MATHDIMEELHENRSKFLELMQKDFNPVATEIDEKYDANRLQELRSNVGELTNVNFGEDDSTAGIAISDAADALRVVTTGRSRLGRLFETHSFHEAIEATSKVDAGSTSVNDLALTDVIRHWNPPSDKTAGEFSTSYVELASVLESLVTDLKPYAEGTAESSDESDQALAELMYAVINESEALIPDVEDIGEGTKNLVAKREEIRASKRAYLSSYRASQKPRASVALSVLFKRVNTQMNRILNARKRDSLSATAFDEGKFVSKSKLLEEQKEWNAALRDAAAIVDTLAKETERIHASIEVSEDAKEENLNAETLATAMDEWIKVLKKSDLSGAVENLKPPASRLAAIEVDMKKRNRTVKDLDRLQAIVAECETRVKGFEESVQEHVNAASASAPADTSDADVD